MEAIIEVQEQLPPGFIDELLDLVRTHRETKVRRQVETEHGDDAES